MLTSGTTRIWRPRKRPRRSPSESDELPSTAVVIRGEKVNLRAVERADAPLVHRWWNDPEVMRFWGAPESTVSLTEVERRVEAWLDDEGEMGRPVCLIVETLEAE